MKYYKIKIKRLYDNDMIAANANGEKVINGQEYFGKIRKGEILKNTPIFDYFYLQSYDKKEYWEWSLFDVHNGIGEYPGNGNWFVSDDCKLLLEQFKIAPNYHFYEAKLLYQEKRLRYWIFQFIASYRKLNKMMYIDFSKSVFYANKQLYYCDSFDKWSDMNEDIYDKYNIDLNPRKIYLNNFFDFIPLNPISSDVICSENLRNAIETMGLTGFEFSELDYEVVVEK